jgi:homoserine kinase
MTKDKFDTSLKSSAYKSRLSKAGPTVIAALSKLKQEEDMVLREHKRYKVLNYHTSRENILQMNK